MSFTSDIKDELCRSLLVNTCCARAEIMGILLHANLFSTSKIKVFSENINIRQRIIKLFKKAFGFEPMKHPDIPNLLEISDKAQIQQVYSAFGYDYKETPLQLNLAVLESECCASAFLRGAFLAGGYVSLGEKGYHFEIVTTHFSVSKQVNALLREMDMPPKVVVRRGNYVIYFKDSGMIEDFLSITGATNSAMELMLKKVDRDLRNKVNRKVNCETANLGKTVEASARQVEAIQKLKDRGLLENLTPALKQTAELRLNNPELSLSELCQLFDPAVSKPGLQGRLRKLEEMSASVQ